MLYSDQAIKLDATSLRAPLACELGCYVLWFRAIQAWKIPSVFVDLLGAAKMMRWYTMNYTSGIFGFAKSNLFFRRGQFFPPDVSWNLTRRITATWLMTRGVEKKETCGICLPTAGVNGLTVIVIRWKLITPSVSAKKRHVLIKHKNTNI